MTYYINEPLTQKLPALYNFMGGNEFVRSAQKLIRLTAAPRHWVGTRIEVKRRGYSYPEDVQVTVRQDDIIVHCNHVKSEIEPVFFNSGHDDEYHRMLAVCQVCGYAVDESGGSYE